MTSATTGMYTPRQVGHLTVRVLEIFGHRAGAGLLQFLCTLWFSPLTPSTFQIMSLDLFSTGYKVVMAKGPGGNTQCPWWLSDPSQKRLRISRPSRGVVSKLKKERALFQDSISHKPGFMTSVQMAFGANNCAVFWRSLWLWTWQHQVLLYQGH